MQFQLECHKVEEAAIRRSKKNGEGDGDWRKAPQTNQTDRMVAIKHTTQEVWKEEGWGEGQGVTVIDINSFGMYNKQF